MWSAWAVELIEEPSHLVGSRAAWNKTMATMGLMCAVSLVLEAQYQQMTNQVTCESVFAHSSKLEEEEVVVVVVAKDLSRSRDSRPKKRSEVSPLPRSRPPMLNLTSDDVPPRLRP